MDKYSELKTHLNMADGDLQLLQLNSPLLSFDTLRGSDILSVIVSVNFVT